METLKWAAASKRLRATDLKGYRSKTCFRKQSHRTLMTLPYSLERKRFQNNGLYVTDRNTTTNTTSADQKLSTLQEKMNSF